MKTPKAVAEYNARAAELAIKYTPFFVSNKCPELPKFERASLCLDPVTAFQISKVFGEMDKQFTPTTIRAKAVAMLEARGSITNRELVVLTNGQTWLTSDLRRDGYIKPKHEDTWEVSDSGKRYKRYYWSGKK